jgi:ribosomal protein S18 acetylase RimI-like enzyme
MTPTLYFLRSSENKIVENMLKFAHPQEIDTKIYSNFYGLTTKDLGLYALVDNTIAGAIWSRLLEDKTVPTLSIAILPAFRKHHIATAMMEQYLVEAGAMYEKLEIETYNEPSLISFLQKFYFIKEENTTLMFKSLEKKEIVRPTDGYDPRKWMD